MAASSSRLWKYDVFLSYRGEDTRKTYVDRLYKALSNQGIRTYKVEDDEILRWGDSIRPSLLEAIEGSQIAVIIFSENYANSSWCLDELEHIMKCRKERGQIVIPIFYKVDPSDVRKLQGEFGRAFAKRKREDQTKEELWRNALADASDIAGWHESTGIKKIVDTILDKLFSLNSDADEFYEDLVGMETRLNSLKSHLDIESGGVHMVGIWGIGGSGKTTLAYSAYKKISHHFEGHCFIDNIREDSNINGLKQLQEKLLSTLLKLDVKVQSVEEGKDKIRRRLRHSNVLIVLDDVDDLDQLEALAGSEKWFGDGSRVIITTRDKHLLEKHKVKISPTSLLSHDEAIQLFNRDALQEDKPIEDYDTLSRQVVSYAGGLPLALKVLGSFLRGKDKNKWLSDLAKLKDIPNGIIMDKLKISYDGLEPSEKRLFLDIACFFRRENVKEVEEILDACEFHSSVGIKVLRQKALITISNGKLDMHDLVQEMGHYIVRGQYPYNPEKHSRVWDAKEIEGMCSMDAAKENDKIEAIQFHGYSSGFPKLVSNMKNLRLLLCSNYRSLALSIDKVSYEWPIMGITEAEVSAQDVEGPSFLSNELRYFHYLYYPGSPFPTTFQPKNLVVLKLDRTLQKELWQGYKHLPHLKTLELEQAENLLSTPDFGGLPHLERLLLSFCGSLKEIHPSLGCHKSLVYVYILKCEKLRTFPTIVYMKKLKALTIENCEALLEFPEIKASMDSLVELRLREVGIKVLPSSLLRYCTNLTLLKVSDCKYLKSIEGNFQALKQLQRLDLDGCKLEDGEIPCDGDELYNLTELNLKSNKFSRLPFSLLQLNRLKVLDVSFCQNLLELPKLPSSVTTLFANGCCSLEYAPGNRKGGWSEKVTSPKGVGVKGGVRRVALGKTIEDHGMELQVNGLEIPKTFIPPLLRGSRCKLQLPENWCDDLCGFFMYAVSTSRFGSIVISMKHEQGGTIRMDPEPGYCEGCGNDGKHGWIMFPLVP